MKSLLFLLALSLSQFAGAVIIYQDTSPLTFELHAPDNPYQVVGYDYDVSIELDQSYSNVTLDLSARGDLGTQDSEYLEFYIDDTLLAKWDYDTLGISVTEHIFGADYTIVGSVQISDELWNTFASDGIIKISWEVGGTVDWGDIGDPDFVSYTLSSIPLPPSIWLLGSALLGLIGINRRR